MSLPLGPPIRIPKGSIEYWPVKVTDARKTINTLEGRDLRYDLAKVVDDENEDMLMENMSADADGMYALPLIDSGPLDPGLYNIYINFIASPQTPRLGPFRFLVDGTTEVV